MRHFVLPAAALATALSFIVPAFAADQPGFLKIGDKKSGDSNDVKMDIIAPGDLERMNAIVRQQGNDVVLQITQGGTTTAKPVEIANGKCPTPGVAQYKLPPFRGGEYQAIVKNAKLDALQNDNHAIAVYSSNGKKRTTYACGDLVKPNLLRH